MYKRPTFFFNVVLLGFFLLGKLYPDARKVKRAKEAWPLTISGGGGGVLDPNKTTAKKRWASLNSLYEYNPSP